MVEHVAYAFHELILLIRNLILYGTIEIKRNGSFYFITYILIIVSAYWIMYFTLIRKINREQYELKLWTVLLISGGVLLNILVFSLCTYHLNALQLILFRLLSINTCILALTVFSKLMEVTHIQKDMAFMQQMTELKGNYYDFLKESISETNIRCHDFKHQIMELRTKQNPDNFSCVLDDMEKTINIYDSISKTGNDALDIVLTEKNILCRKKDIRFTYLTNCEKLDSIEKKDIYNLFGNILDNAIEAVQKIPDPEKRVINLSIQCKGNLLNIQSCNYFNEELTFINGIPKTTKSNPTHHGYGMKSIRLIIEKYGGEIQINTNEHIFDLNILIPLK